MTTTPEIAQIHTLYCQLTGFALPMDFYRESCWNEWFKAGLTEQDLKLLIKHHQDQARQGRPARSLLFRSMVVNTDYAREDIALIKAIGRAAPVTARDRVLRYTGREPVEDTPARSAEQVIKDCEAFKEFLEFKKTL